MAIFNSYVKLPEGIRDVQASDIRKNRVIPTIFCQEAWSMRRVRKLRAAISPASTWYDTAPPGPWKFTDWFEGHLRLKIQRNFEGKLYIDIYIYTVLPAT